MPSLVRGPLFSKVPIDYSGLDSKDIAFFDALKSYLTDELEWHIPTVKRGMSTSI